MAKEDSKPKWLKSYEEAEKKYGPAGADLKLTYSILELGPKEYEAIRKFEADPRTIEAKTDEDIIKIFFQ